jgi:hypothetical protein
MNRAEARYRAYTEGKELLQACGNVELVVEDVGDRLRLSEADRVELRNALVRWSEVNQ